MEWNVMWTPWTGTGLEHLQIQYTPDGLVINNVVVGLKQERPFRLWYEILCDRQWKVQNCALRLLGGHAQEINLQTDDQGHWANAVNDLLPALDGCIDVDISVTPFTNTLPIRRLSLRPDQSVDLLVAYIAVPEMEAQPVKQRYTCLETNDDGGLYRYESLTSGYVTELRVDAQGLVLDYPENWKRRWDNFGR